jgi:hypothetical protein
LTRGFLKLMDGSFTRANALARRVAGKRALDLNARAVYTAGSLSFVAQKPPSAIGARDAEGPTLASSIS